MNTCIFYVTGQLLGHITKHSFSKPAKLSDSPFSVLAFQLFQHRIRAKCDVAYLPQPLWENFEKSTEFKSFQTVPVLKMTFKPDLYSIKYSDDFETIIKSASFSAGGNGDKDYFIIACEDEVDQFRKKAAGYPISVLTVEEAIDKISSLYPEE